MVTPRTGRPRGRPKGSKDGALSVRKLTAEEAKEILESVQVIRAKTKLAAWSKLAEQLERLEELPGKDRTAVLALALKYSEDRTPTPLALVQVNVDQGEAPVSGADLVRQRLAALAARQQAQDAAETGPAASWADQEPVSDHRPDLERRELAQAVSGPQVEPRVPASLVIPSTVSTRSTDGQVIVVVDADPDPDPAPAPAVADDRPPYGVTRRTARAVGWEGIPLRVGRTR